MRAGDSVQRGLADGGVSVHTASADPLSALDCQHEQSRPVRRIVANGAVHYHVQCLSCGDSLKAIPKQERIALQPDEIGEWDESLKDRWWQRRSDIRRLQAVRERAAKFDDMADYYASEKWRAKSAAVLARDRICQACRGRPAQEAHHLTYDHWRDEPLFDLVGVCHPCHEKITAMDRRRRGVS